MERSNIEKLKNAIERADHIVIGAGAGLSLAAGMFYAEERFNRYFSDFAARYGFRDMYSGGFCPYETLEEYWAYWSRYVWINRYAPIPGTVYNELLSLVAGKDYFVLTTNVDHCFQRSGFAKERLFYTQGDYGLFQCSKPCCAQTYDNKDLVRKMVLAQGFSLSAEDELLLSGEDETHMPLGRDFQVLSMRVPSELVPHCPQCGRPLSMNLRADDTFVEDEGWHEARARYESFLRACDASNRCNAKGECGESDEHNADNGLEAKGSCCANGGHVLLLELGVGFNTPVIVKYPFWRMAAQNKNVTYACINQGEAYIPNEIAACSIGINSDIAAVLGKL